MTQAKTSPSNFYLGAADTCSPLACRIGTPTGAFEPRTSTFPEISWGAGNGPLSLHKVSHVSISSSAPTLMKTTAPTTVTQQRLIEGCRLHLCDFPQTLPGTPFLFLSCLQQSSSQIFGLTLVRDTMVLFWLRREVSKNDVRQTSLSTALVSRKFTFVLVGTVRGPDGVSNFLPVQASVVSVAFRV